MASWGIWLIVIGSLMIIFGINGLCRASARRDKAESAFWDENFEEQV